MMPRAMRLWGWGCRLTCSRFFQRHHLSTQYPPHKIVGMPALSPTMEGGTIFAWLKKPGELIIAGETIAEIETDKATVGFDSVDDMYIAKILVEAGTEVKVGDPVMVTVEDESDVSKFSDFQISASTSGATPVAATPRPAQAEVKPAAGPAVVENLPASPPPQSKSAAPTPLATPTDTPETPSSPSTSIRSESDKLWGKYVSKSPLALKLSLDQEAYVTKYGRTCHNIVEKS